MRVWYGIASLDPRPLLNARIADLPQPPVATPDCDSLQCQSIKSTNPYAKNSIYKSTS